MEFRYITIVLIGLAMIGLSVFGTSLGLFGLQLTGYASIPVSVLTYNGQKWVLTPNIRVDCYNVTSQGDLFYVSNTSDGYGIALFTPPADDAGQVHVKFKALANVSDTLNIGAEYWPYAFKVGVGPIETPIFQIPSLKDILLYGGIGVTLFGATVFVYPKAVPTIVIHPQRRKHYFSVRGKP